MDDLSQRANNFAIYTPSVQTHSASRIMKGCVLRNGDTPRNLKAEDFNFFNPHNKYWSYKWILATAGHFKDESKPNIVTHKHQSAFVLGDSGGFQIGKGTLGETKKWKRYANQPQTIIDLWTNSSIKREIIEWLDLNCDYAMTIDMPLWVKDKGNEASLFHNLSIQELLNLSVDNLRFIQNNRGKLGACKYLNVLQGSTEADEELWFQTVKNFKFEGWSFAGGVGQMGGIYRVLRRVMLLRDQKLLENGYDWIHILRLSRPKWSPLLTATQRGIQRTVNEKFKISFDSSSPYQIGGKAVRYAVLNSFGSNLSKDWGISTPKFPTGYGYANKFKRMKLNRSHTDHLLFPLTSPIASLLNVQDLNYKKGTKDIRTFDAFSDEVILNHNVYIYCLANILANESVFSSKPTAPDKMIKAVEIIDRLFDVENWDSYLTLNRGLLASVVGEKN